MVHRAGAPRSGQRRRSSGLGRLLGWLGLLAAAIWVLTTLGDGPLGVPSILDGPGWRAWLAERDAVTIAFAALRLLTLAMAWYLLGATAVGLVARLVADARLIAAADVLAVPRIRQLLQTAFGAGLATASLTAGSAWTVPDVRPPSAPAAALAERPTEAGPIDRALVMTPGPPAQMLDPVADPPVPPPASPAPPPAMQTWTVRRGDHLWSIAERTLTGAWEHAPSDEQTAAYWQRLIARNRSRLADPGNPDLIMAGQVFELPPVPPS